ncbi:hypothetical protein [Clavibacter michiganensis]|uniref:hypothetical protein n=1 Tax=Clavibacter michiganensis TaxID=28447 RepID=UPI00105535B2|nr:hypothetical protein [Clavibacter michiganensis]
MPFDTPDGTPEEHLVKLQDPDKVQRRWIERIKLNFSMILALICIVAAIAVAQVDYWHSSVDGANLDASFDMLRTFATIALGFTFGRAFDGKG